MSRVAWKYLYFTDYDLCTYLKTQLKQSPCNDVVPNIRLKTLNRWNYSTVYFVDQGKIKVLVKPSLYHINFKLGAFAKTRKPFFFRSKKKKKMQKINFYSFGKLKYSNNTCVRSSFCETNKLITQKKYVSLTNFFNFYYYNYFFLIWAQRETANIVLKDLVNLTLAWRQIKGYPSGGATTHTNAKSSRKNKLLLFYRIDQFNKLFGQKKRNIYPTLIKAEYTNKLWFTTWFLEWFEARWFSIKMAKLKGRAGNFNPVLLAGNQTNGYTRVGKAAKIGKAKKLVKVFTVGVPVFFSRYIYYQHPPHGFPVKLLLREEVNKKLGKRIRKNK